LRLFLCAFLVGAACIGAACALLYFPNHPNEILDRHLPHCEGRRSSPRHAGVHLQHH
jgi:hypothetical protein